MQDFIAAQFMLVRTMKDLLFLIDINMATKNNTENITLTCFLSNSLDLVLRILLDTIIRTFL